VPLCICNTKLYLANFAETMKNNCLARAVTTKCLVYLYKLYLPCHKVLDVRNIREAKGTAKLLRLNPNKVSSFLSRMQLQGLESKGRRVSYSTIQS
jgi:hypothetical protein